MERENFPLDHIPPPVNTNWAFDISHRWGRCGGRMFRQRKTHRWLSISEQPPIDFGEPFMLLNLTCPTLASQPRKLVLVKQLDDYVLARSRDKAISSPPEKTIIRTTQPRNNVTALGRHAKARIPRPESRSQTHHPAEPRDKSGVTAPRTCYSRRGLGCILEMYGYL